MKKLLRSTAFVALGIGFLTPVSAASADVSVLATCNRTVSVKAPASWVSPRVIPSSGSTAASTNCGMAQGAHSAAVANLQRNLNACYGENLRVDSDFGALTREALRRAQRAEGISADGVYGPETRNNLMTYGQSVCSPPLVPIQIA